MELATTNRKMSFYSKLEIKQLIDIQSNYIAIYVLIFNLNKGIFLQTCLLKYIQNILCYLSWRSSPIIKLER